MADIYTVVDKSIKKRKFSLQKQESTDKNYAMLEQQNFDLEEDQDKYHTSNVDANDDVTSIPIAPSISKASKERKEMCESEFKHGTTKLAVSLVITLVVFAIVFFICQTIAFVEIYRLKSTRVSSSQLASQLSTLNTSFSAFKESIFDTLLGQVFSIPANSCSALLPSTPSGYYWVMPSNGSAVRVYCDMNLECGNVTGRWMRVAQLDMTDSSQQCPDGLNERADPNRTCVSSSSSFGCSPRIIFKTFGMSYTRVCGKVIGYQIGHTNAFSNHHSNINSVYVDGVSLTHGSPRQHIWTFAAARDAFNDSTKADSKCLCISNGASQPPQFVEDDYFCDTGANSRNIGDGMFFNQPLWDGKGCIGLNNCCDFNTPPWFYQQLPQPTTDDIEMRLCRNEDQSDEDIAIQKVDVYVK